MQSGPVPPQSNSTHRAWCVAGCPARLPSRMPQRGNGTKPRVAAFAPLPWVGRPTHRPNPNGVVALRRGACPQREHHDGVLDRGAPVLPGRCPGLAYNALSGLRTAGPARPAGHTSRTPPPQHQPVPASTAPLATHRTPCLRCPNGAMEQSPGLRRSRRYPGLGVPPTTPTPTGLWPCAEVPVPNASTLTGCDIGRCVRRGCCTTLSGCCERGVPWYPGRCPGLAYNALSGLRTAGPARPAGHTSRTPSPIASTSQGPTAGQPRPRMNGHARNQPTPQPTAHSLDRSRASRAQRWLSPTRVAAGQPFASIRDLFGGGPDPYVPAMRTSPAGPGRPCHLKTTREPGTCYAGCAGPPATACRHG
jgi:hypothetical protein